MLIPGLFRTSAVMSFSIVFWERGHGWDVVTQGGDPNSGSEGHLGWLSCAGGGWHWWHLQEGAARWDQALIPGNQGQDKRERPQVAPGEIQVGYQGEFPHGKGCTV